MVTGFNILTIIIRAFGFNELTWTGTNLSLIS